MMMDQPRSDLYGAVQHERSLPWPQDMRIVATWPDGSTTEFAVSAAQFYGHETGAPLGAAALLGAMERLARSGPSRK
jgi:hypothetical protein